jgi:hypothetical protein
VEVLKKMIAAQTGTEWEKIVLKIGQYVLTSLPVIAQRLIINIGTKSSRTTSHLPITRFMTGRVLRCTKASYLELERFFFQGSGTTCFKVCIAKVYR